MSGNGNKRFELLRSILKDRRYFKLVCGAGNEDAEEVKRLSLVFTLAGATSLDLSANVDVVKAAKSGIDMAFDLAEEMGRKIELRPYMNVSIGLKGDPHVMKARIDADLCTECGECIEPCPQDAIDETYVVKEYRCIGCGECGKVCPVDAVVYYHKKADFDKVLPECVALGTETMELHAVTEDEVGTERDWKLLADLIEDNYLSMCLDRSLLSNVSLIDRVRRAQAVVGDRMIVQADGVPMSGEGDDFNTTLQAIACADVVGKSGVPVMILLSGGTNSKTGELARQCGVEANGVSLGSYARKIVREHIQNENFYDDRAVLEEAVRIAEELIRVNIEAISG